MVKTNFAESSLNFFRRFSNVLFANAKIQRKFEILVFKNRFDSEKKILGCMYENRILKF